MGGKDVHSRIDIAKRFIDMGFDVEILGQRVKIDLSIVELNIEDILHREFGVLDDLKTISSLRDILKSYPDGTIVHAFDTKPTIFLPLSSVGIKGIMVVRP